MSSPAVDHLLDTDVCVDLIRGRIPSQESSSARVALGSSAISSVTVAELEFGVAHSPLPNKSRRQLDEFLERTIILDFDRDAAQHYGQIRNELAKRGASIGPLDLMIAAHARSLNATLLTANLRGFRRVAGLKCRPWR